MPHQSRCEWLGCSPNRWTAACIRRPAVSLGLGTDTQQALLSLGDIRIRGCAMAWTDDSDF